jgi:hypothetical protein
MPTKRVCLVGIFHFSFISFRLKGTPQYKCLFLPIFTQKIAFPDFRDAALLHILRGPFFENKLIINQLEAQKRINLALNGFQSAFINDGFFIRIQHFIEGRNGQQIGQNRNAHEHHDA